MIYRFLKSLATTLNLLKSTTVPCIESNSSTVIKLIVSPFLIYIPSRSLKIRRCGVGTVVALTLDRHSDLDDSREYTRPSNVTVLRAVETLRSLISLRNNSIS